MENFLKKRIEELDEVARQEVAEKTKCTALAMALRDQINGFYHSSPAGQVYCNLEERPNKVSVARNDQSVIFEVISSSGVFEINADSMVSAEKPPEPYHGGLTDLADAIIKTIGRT